MFLCSTRDQSSVKMAGIGGKSCPQKFPESALQIKPSRTRNLISQKTRKSTFEQLAFLREIQSVETPLKL